MKRLVIDLDDTLAYSSGGEYADARVVEPIRRQLIKYRAEGFEIVIHSSRNMRTFSGQVGKINVHTLPIIIEWLDRHEIPYDEVIVGKPWCGFDGLYVDDKAVRPHEFAELSYEEIGRLLDEAARRLKALQDGGA